MLCRRFQVAVVFALALAGCTSTGQKFTERTYSEPDAAGNQYVVDEVIVKNRTVAAPFSSRADSTHDMLAEIEPDGSWHLEMGSTGELDGGEIATALEALTGILAELSVVLRELKTP